MTIAFKEKKKSRRDRNIGRGLFNRNNRRVDNSSDSE
jgi:hypothetical protein